MSSGRDRDIPFDLQLKLLMIGDSGKLIVKISKSRFYAVSFLTEVGKTCLIWRYAADQFSSKTMNTIGIDFKIKHVKIDDMRIKLQVLHT